MARVLFGTFFPNNFRNSDSPSFSPFPANLIICWSVIVSPIISIHGIGLPTPGSSTNGFVLTIVGLSGILSSEGSLVSNSNTIPLYAIVNSSALHPFHPFNFLKKPPRFCVKPHKLLSQNKHHNHNHIMSLLCDNHS